ncbi:hypothetical protein Ddc_23108 [Ditylenchus destructor]|nr:hypothetical protein Ddc_23108 [Ditylenchus destructor]
MARLLHRLQQMAEGAVLPGARRVQMRVDRLHVEGDHQPAQHAEDHQRQERRVPVEVRGQEDRERQAQHLAGREAALQQPHHAPRCAGGNRSATMAMTMEPITPPNRPVTTRASSSDSKLVARPHHSVPSRKAGVEEQQQLLAVVAVGENPRSADRPARAERVGRNDGAERAELMDSAGMITAPSGDMIMKSRTTANCSSVSRPSAKRWYEVKGIGAAGRPGAAAAAGEFDSMTWGGFCAPDVSRA